MKISSGLFDGMVLQRNAQEVTEAVVSGNTSHAGTVIAEVTRGGEAIFACPRAVGEAARGAFRCRLDGIPVGGPYAITLRVEDARGAILDTLTVRDVLVGDVWVLGGQSNMQGCGNREDAAAPHPLVRAFYMDDRWGVAEDPLHDLSTAVDVVHTALNGGARPAPPAGKGVGSGVAFGQEMFRHTGVPQGLIACAHGGTTMTQWDPALKRRKGASLYGAMVRRVRKNGGKVAGVVWYQGCSDANPSAAQRYTERMKALARAMRRDLGGKDLPIVAVQISRVYGWPREQEAHWNSIQEQQRRLPAGIKRCAVVPAIDLTLDDAIHISGKDQQVLGARLAQAMRALKDGVGTPPIAFDRAEVVQNPRSGLADVVVHFTNVEGELRASGRPCGLELVDTAGASYVFHTALQGSSVVLRTTRSAVDVTRCKLWYGRGFAPYCNITDGAGRSLPVLGPITLGERRAATDFARAIRVSALQPSAGRIDRLPYPQHLEALGLQPRTFSGEFCDIHPMTLSDGDGNAVAYYACRIRCPEEMKLKVLLGYDGPVKLWIDGVKKFADPHGANPAVQDTAQVPFTAREGTHEVLVALDANDGKAWGIFLRFERVDVAKRLLARGPECVTLPVIEG